MKTKEEAKKEALKISVRKTFDTVLVLHNGSIVREIGFTPLVKDAPYFVWCGDRKPDFPSMRYHTGEGMKFYESRSKQAGDHELVTEWEHCEKIEVG